MKELAETQTKIKQPPRNIQLNKDFPSFVIPYGAHNTKADDILPGNLKPWVRLLFLWVFRSALTPLTSLHFVPSPCTRVIFTAESGFSTWHLSG